MGKLYKFKKELQLYLNIGTVDTLQNIQSKFLFRAILIFSGQLSENKAA